MKKALYAGSFDPITLGHIHTIKKALELFDLVYVVVASNPTKTGYFPIRKRVSLVEQSLEGIPNVLVISSLGEYVVKTAERLGVTHLVRGLPTIADFSMEYEMYHNNRDITSKIETVFLMCDKDVQQVRSSTIRGLLGFTGWMEVVKNKVPAPVLRALVDRIMGEMFAVLAHQFYAGNTDVYWQRLSQAYDRPYHNFIHVLRMLDRSKEFVVADRFLFELAIWYHDFVDPCCENAEEKSRNVAFELMRAIPDQDYLGDLIMATAQNVSALTNDQVLMRCLDREILASSWEQYEAYVHGIEQEYANTCSPEEFNKGRCEFLNTLLASPIFQNHPAFIQQEEVAKHNIRRELDLRMNGQWFSRKE